MPAFQGSREISGAVTPTTNDDGWLLRATSSATVTLTNSGWTVGRSAIGFRQKGAGAITFVAGAGVTLRNVAGDLVTNAQHSSALVTYDATNEWTIDGTEPPQLPDGSVTLAKMQSAAGPFALGRVSGTGAPIRMTPAQMRQASQTAGPVYDVRHYGAVGDGVADDTAAIQAAYNAAGNDPSAGTVGADVFFGPGEFVITETITLNRWSGRSIGSGSGNSPEFASVPGNATVIRWDGANTDPVFLVTDSRRAIWERIRWEAGANKPTYAIEFDSTIIGHGSNTYCEVADCVFGQYPWSSQGLNSGALAGGLGFTGTNQMNDRIRLDNCLFEYCDIGVDIINSQSIWTSLTNCVFTHCGIGLVTAASLQMFNTSFGQNDLDIDVRSTAVVSVFGCNSENAKQFARLGSSSTLACYGGVVQFAEIEAADGVFVDMHPANRSVLHFEGIRFDELTNPALARIEVGGQSPSFPGNWSIYVHSCSGISPAQIAIQDGAFWATSPRSRGRVEWGSRVIDTNYAFRNYLATGFRTAIDADSVDLHPLTNAIGVEGDGTVVGIVPGDVATGLVRIGASALAARTSAANVVAIGDEALEAATSGSQHVALGRKALESVTTNSGSTAVGDQAGRQYTGQFSTFIGHLAGQNATTGNQSVLIGYNSGASLTTNGAAVGVGASANPSGFGAVAVGFTTTASANNAVAIGNAVTASAVGSFAMGNGSAASADNALSLGSSSAASAASAVALGVSSSAAHGSSLALGSSSATTTTNQVAIAARHIEALELAADPAAPATNAGRLYFRDNGSGKTQLCVRFATGAVQVIATEP